MITVTKKTRRKSAAGVVSGTASGGSVTVVEGHTHNNLSLLQSLRLDIETLKLQYEDGDIAIGRADTAGYAARAGYADSTAEADHAGRASMADSAEHAGIADFAGHADTADEARHADKAEHAFTANEADHAGRASMADSAEHAGIADLAETARAVHTLGALPGALGSGAVIARDNDGTAQLDIDRLLVRQSLEVPVLRVDTVRAVGGVLVVSAAAATVDTMGEDADGKWLTVKDTTGAFVQHDFMRWGTYDRGTFRAGTVRIWQISGDRLYFVRTGGTAEFPQPGDAVVQFGNYSGASRRQGLVVIDCETLAVDVHKGVGGGILTQDTLAARLGRLDGLCDDVLGNLSGHGLFAANAYLKGRIAVRDNDGRDVELQTALDGLHLRLTDFAASHPNIAARPYPRDGVINGYFEGTNGNKQYDIAAVTPGQTITIQLRGDFSCLSRIVAFLGSWSSSVTLTLDDSRTVATGTAPWPQEAAPWLALQLKAISGQSTADATLTGLIVVKADHIPADAAAGDFMQTALLGTGIDIEKRRVTVTADTFRIRANDGTETAAVDADGTLTAARLVCLGADGTPAVTVNASGDPATVVHLPDGSRVRYGYAEINGFATIAQKYKADGTLDWVTPADGGANTRLDWSRLTWLTVEEPPHRFRPSAPVSPWSLTTLSDKDIVYDPDRTAPYTGLAWSILCDKGTAESEPWDGEGMPYAIRRVTRYRDGYETGHYYENYGQPPADWNWETQD